MTAVDPLYTVSCDTCGRAYLSRLEELVRADGRMLGIGFEAVGAARVPDAEDVLGAARETLTADVVEWSARLRRESAYLRRASDRLLADARAALAVARAAFGDDEPSPVGAGMTRV